MNTYVKAIKTALGNKYVSLPLYAIAGTSAFFFIRHLVSRKAGNGTVPGDNFRAASTQFENRQLGVAEQPAAAASEVKTEELSSVLDEITAEEIQAPEQCKAITVKGTRCKKKAVEGGYCNIHKGH